MAKQFIGVRVDPALRAAVVARSPNLSAAIDASLRLWLAQRDGQAAHGERTDDGSLFDLATDSAGSIARAMVGNLPADKADRIVKAMVPLIRAKKARRGQA
jgi:hypothetical protein